MIRNFYLFIISAVLILGSCSNGDLSEIEGTGTIEAIQVDISSGIAGEIKSIAVEEGDKVKTGDVILTIDDSDFRIQHKLANARLDGAQARLNLLLAGAREEDVQQAQEQVKASKAAFEKAEANFTRIKNLFDSGSATKSLFDEAKAGYDMAQANHQGSQKMLEKLLKGARPEEIEIARANKVQAEASLELIEKKIADCIINSPLNGTVTNKLIEAGERIAPNGIAVTIVKTDSMWLTIYVGEKYIGRIATGQKAQIKIDSYKDRIFPGVVKYIAEEAEFTPKNIQTKDEREKLVFGVKIKIDNSDGILKAGLPADAIIKIM